MKANYEDKIKQETSTSEVSLGNYYEMNKQLMANEPALTAEELTEAKDMLYDYALKHYAQKYFMLLCHERRDYTLFNLGENPTSSVRDKSCSTFAFDVIDCMQNRGQVIAADEQDDGAIEIWIRDEENEMAAYYLFPYGAAVIECFGGEN